MILIKDNSLCCGCSSCEQICLQNCIKMMQDKEGFLYPVVDESKCLLCNECNKVCPIEGIKPVNVDMEKIPPKAYGGWHNDDSIRYDSSSGGAFTLFAESIINNDGIVFGCALDEHMQAVHIGVDSIDALTKLRGSKYVQSKIGNTYSQVEVEVKKGRQVLFVGTPCQAAGLCAFLGNKDYDNLYVIDFICHGVPSPAIFKNYMESEESKRKSKIISHKFRNKDHGWSQTGLQLGSCSKYEDGTSKRRYPAFFDSFMNGFLDDIYLRPSCYDCKFKTIPKNYADITIADFWGVDKIDIRLDDKKGTSLILVNTMHGEKLWKKVKVNGRFKEVAFDRAIKRNTSLIKSAKMNPKRNSFFKDYYKKGFEYVEKKYLPASVWAWHKVLKMLKK